MYDKLKKISILSIAVYLFSLFVINILFSPYVAPTYLLLEGLIFVILFFISLPELYNKSVDMGDKKFEKYIFTLSLVLRLIYIIIILTMYNEYTGTLFEYNSVDSSNYHKYASIISSSFRNGDISEGVSFMDFLSFSDSGYVLYLSILYTFFGDSIIIPCLIKCIISSYSCLIIYRLSLIYFHRNIAILAAVISVILPYNIYFCGLNLKEVEMSFILLYFVYLSLKCFKFNGFNFFKVLKLLLLILLLFSLRSVLGLAAFFALSGAALFESSYIKKRNSRSILITVLFVVVVFSASTVLYDEFIHLWQRKDTNLELSYQSRLITENANKYISYFTGIVFLPMIFTIPFPSVVNIINQESIIQLHGAYFIKNILSISIMFAIYYIVKQKKVKDFTMLLLLVLTYLAIIAFAGFAQSGRFHFPVFPLLIPLIALGLYRTKFISQSIFIVMLLFIFVFWNYFKLAGRGLI